MPDFQSEKRVVQSFYEALDRADIGALDGSMALYCAPDLLWRGMHPWNCVHGPSDVAEVFWAPLRRAFTHLQRREQVFFAGANHMDDRRSVWVASMGHLLGLFDEDFLGFSPTRKATFLRYADFHRVESGKIVETACYLDVLDVLAQAGIKPLPVQTGASVLIPGPLTQDGLLRHAAPPNDGEKTMHVLNAMLSDLIGGGVESPADELARSWTPDMLWYGPEGIGTTFTQERYREQHAGPFEDTLEFIRHNGHQCRIAEGHYAGFFGYPSLTMKMRGGFMGLPASDTEADMRIVDIYRRQGPKLAENWIFIDIPHFLRMQGIDILEQAHCLAEGG